MIFNLTGDDTAGKIEKFQNKYLSGIRPFITDAVHIYCGTTYSGVDTPWYLMDNIWLVWKPGDPVEPQYSVTSNVKAATTTLMIDPFAFGGRPSTQNVYIPYATSLETFNSEWQKTSDGSADNLVYTQQCFKTPITVHVNSTLYAYMSSHSDVWGNIMSNVVADM